MKDFIHDLQMLDEARKKRWLIGLSLVAMIVVIGIWVINLNLSIAGVAQLDNPYASDKPSIMSILMAGFFILADKTTTGLTNSYVYFNKKAQSNNTITLKKDEFNFIYEGAGTVEVHPFQ